MPLSHAAREIRINFYSFEKLFLSNEFFCGLSDPEISSVQKGNGGIEVFK
jgi:hypothetical protein